MKRPEYETDKDKCKRLEAELHDEAAPRASWSNRGAVLVLIGLTLMAATPLLTTRQANVQPTGTAVGTLYDAGLSDFFSPANHVHALGVLSGGPDAAVRVAAPGIVTPRAIVGELCLGDAGCVSVWPSGAGAIPFCADDEVLTNDDAGYRCVLADECVADPWTLDADGGLSRASRVIVAPSGPAIFCAPDDAGCKPNVARVEIESRLAGGAFVSPIAFAVYLPDGGEAIVFDERGNGTIAVALEVYESISTPRLNTEIIATGEELLVTAGSMRVDSDLTVDNDLIVVGTVKGENDASVTIGPPGLEVNMEYSAAHISAKGNYATAGFENGSGYAGMFWRERVGCTPRSVDAGSSGTVCETATLDNNGLVVDPGHSGSFAIHTLFGTLALQSNTVQVIGDESVSGTISGGADAAVQIASPGIKTPLINVGATTGVTGFVTGSASLSLTATTKGVCQSGAFSVSGAVTGQPCVVGTPASVYGSDALFDCTCAATSSGNVTARCCCTATNCNTPSGDQTLKVLVVNY